MIRRLAVACVLLTAAFAIPATPVRAQIIEESSPIELIINRFPSDPKGAIAAARQLIAAGKLDLAIQSLARYVAVHPQEAAPRRFLGDLYFRAGNITQAKWTYEEILNEYPYDKETHNRLGTVYSVENDIDDAIKQFNEALPGTDSVGDLVALHERKGDLPKYRAEMEHLADVYPNDPALQGELAQVYMAIHEPVLAMRYFERALDQDPRDITALNGLGLAYMAEHQYPNAIKQFQACLGIAPETYQCENNLGAAQLNAGQLDVAKKALDIAFHLAPERAETFVNYGFYDDAKGDWRGAVADYAKAIAIWPYQREAYIDIALAYEAHDLYPLAQAALLKGLASVPDDGRMRFLLGRAYEAQGRRADALAQFRLAAQGTDPQAARIAKAEFTGMSPNATPTPQR